MFFAQVTLLLPPIPCFTMFSIDQTLPKVPLPVGHLHSHVIHVPWTYPTQHSRLHLVFAQITAESHYTLQYALNRD